MGMVGGGPPRPGIPSSSSDVKNRSEKYPSSSQSTEELAVIMGETCQLFSRGIAGSVLTRTDVLTFWSINSVSGLKVYLCHGEV